MAVLINTFVIKPGNSLIKKRLVITCATVDWINIKIFYCLVLVCGFNATVL